MSHFRSLNFDRSLLELCIRLSSKNLTIFWTSREKINWINNSKCLGSVFSYYSQMCGKWWLLSCLPRFFFFAKYELSFETVRTFFSQIKLLFCTLKWLICFLSRQCNDSTLFYWLIMCINLDGKSWCSMDQKRFDDSWKQLLHFYSTTKKTSFV